MTQEFDEGSFRDNIRVASTIHRDLDFTRNNIRQMSKNIKEVSKTVQVLAQQLLTFSEQFQQFSFTEDTSKKEPTMYIIGLMYKDYSHIFNQFQLSWQTSSNLMEKCAREVLVTENLSDVKLRVTKASDNFDKLQKKAQAEKNIKAKAKQDLILSGLDLNAATVDYYDKLNKMNSQSRKEFWDQLIEMMEVNDAMVQTLYTTTTQYKQERLLKFSESKKGIDEYHFLEQLQNTTIPERKQKKLINLLPEEPITEQVNTEIKDDSIISGILLRMHGRKQWSNRWVVIGNDGILRVYKKKRDIDTGSNVNKTPKESKGPKEASEFELILCTVRPVQDPKQLFSFELIHPRKRVTFKADNLTDYQKWIEAITNAIGTAIASSSELTNKRMSYFPEDFSALHQLMNEPSNKVCADCDKQGPEWVSINTGVFICIECSGIHRSFGTHISKVRSLTMDAFSTNLISYLELLPNKVVNSIYEAEIPPAVTKPNPDSSRAERLQWLTSKYVEKSMVPKFQGTEFELQEALYSSISKSDVVNFLKLIAQGAKPEYVHEGKTFLSNTIIQNNQLMAEALIVSGADVNAVSSDGRPPLYFAIEKGILSLVKLLVGHDADLQSDKQGCDPLGYIAQCKERDKSQEYVTALDNIETYLHRKISSYPKLKMILKGTSSNPAILPKVFSPNTPSLLTARKANKLISPRPQDPDQPSPAKNLFRDGAALPSLSSTAEVTQINQSSGNLGEAKSKEDININISLNEIHPETHHTEHQNVDLKTKAPLPKLTVKFSEEQTISSVIWQRDIKLSQLLKKLCDARSLVLENYEVRDLESLTLLDIDKTLGSLQVFSVLVQKKTLPDNTKQVPQSQTQTAIEELIGIFAQREGTEESNSYSTPNWKRKSAKRFSAKKTKSTTDLLNKNVSNNK